MKESYQLNIIKLVKLKILLTILFFTIMLPLQAQSENPIVNDDEKLYYIGMTLVQLIERMGAPQASAVARGNEAWQDDVVFQYAEGDFFIHRDRVWQARFSSACGISVGDRKAAVMQTLGNTATDNGDHALLSIHGKNWLITLRVNFNEAEQAGSIFIYRSDF